MQSPILKRVSLLLGGLLVGLILAEVVARQFAGNPLREIEETRVGWKARGFVPDEELEYSFEPGYEGRMVLPGIFDAAYRINGQGFRDDVDFEGEHPGKYRILLVGDSFVFGVGVALEETIGKHIERVLNNDADWGQPTEVVAIGAPGYGLDSYAALLERWVPRLSPDLIVVAMFSLNDLVDYEFRFANRRTAVGGYMVRKHEAWSYNLRKFSTVAHLLLSSFNPHPVVDPEAREEQTPEETARVYETIRPLIQRLGHACDGVRLALTVLEDKWSLEARRAGATILPMPTLPLALEDFRSLNATLLETLPAWEKAGYPVERAFHEKDAHYTASGCRIVGRALAREIRKKIR